ncbi:MAG: hypothetical protein P8P32_07530 [Akkermansiaceae bacterium]|nr:hypothetical protein [Akkermansiaceae bacterium]
MALLAEEIVQEWLNRLGYFTIRGVRLGVDEIDLLAVRFVEGLPECRHIEVQASMRPISYISRVPKVDQRAGVRPNSASRTDQQLIDGVAEWVDKKFFKPKKKDFISGIFPNSWTSELVLNNVKSEEEVQLIAEHGIIIHRLPDVVAQMKDCEGPIKSASGADFFDLITLGTKQAEQGAAPNP